MLIFIALPSAGIKRDYNFVIAFNAKYDAENVLFSEADCHLKVSVS